MSEISTNRNLLSAVAACAAFALASCASGTSERYSCTGEGGDVKLELVEGGTYPERVIDVDIIQDVNGFCEDGKLDDSERNHIG